MPCENNDTYTDQPVHLHILKSVFSLAASILKLYSKTISALTGRTTPKAVY